MSDNTPAKIVTIKGIFEGDTAKKKFQEMLGQKAQGFITSVLQIVSSDQNLINADPMSVYYAAATAATLDLPVNQNLGFTWIIGYGGKAQFQVGYKGFIQLALRTGQYLRINSIPVYANQFKSWNNLTEELNADFSFDGEGEIVGYCSYFKLVNGFEKTMFWTKKKVEQHARRFSKAFDRGPWKTDFDTMACKTVLKNMLTKYGILSIELQKALVVDQAVIKDENATDVQYIDNEELSPAEKAENATKSAEATLKKKAGKDASKQMEADLSQKTD